MRKPSQQDKTDAEATLRKLCPPDATVYTINRHTSASGMTRYLDVYVMVDNHPRRLTWSVGAFLGYPYNDKYDCLTVQGCGMDMGFHLVSSLSRALYPNVERPDYQFRHEWL